MAESRDSSLPGGAKELIDLIKECEQTDQTYAKVRDDMRFFCRQLAPKVFDTLAQQIDHDLLYTEDGDLVLPKLREAAGQALSGGSAELAREYGSWWATDILVQEVWRLICLRRPFRNEA